jgi:hypothetical protein
MDIKRIESVVSQVPHPVDLTIVKVCFGGGILSDFSAAYAQTVNRRASFKMDITFDEGDMQRYLNFLLKTRISQVVGGKFDRRVRRLFIPAMFSLSLAHIGVVMDKATGVKLVPSLDDKVDAMTIDEAVAFSDELGFVEDLGFELVCGLPRDIDGDVNFMMFIHSEGYILRHNNLAHPAYAVLSAFFRMKQLESVLSFRVNYGFVAEYEEMLRGLIFDEGRQSKQKVG